MAAYKNASFLLPLWRQPHGLAWFWRSWPLPAPAGLPLPSDRLRSHFREYLHRQSAFFPIAYGQQKVLLLCWGMCYKDPIFHLFPSPTIINLMNKSQIVIVAALAAAVVGLIVVSQTSGLSVPPAPQPAAPQAAAPQPTPPAAPAPKAAASSPAAPASAPATPALAMPAPQSAATARTEHTLEEARSDLREYFKKADAMSLADYAALRAKSPRLPPTYSEYIARLKTRIDALDKMTQEDWVQSRETKREVVKQSKRRRNVRATNAKTARMTRNAPATAQAPEAAAPAPVAAAPEVAAPAPAAVPAAPAAQPAAPAAAPAPAAQPAAQ